MKFKGFTLAEILVTLGIIGVVAALTLPGMNVNAQKRSLEAGFSKIVRDLKTVNRIVATEKNAKTLKSACGIPLDATDEIINKTYLSCISDYYDIVPKVNPAVTYSNMPGGESGVVAAKSDTYFLSKDGTMGFMPRIPGESNDYKNIQVYVDLNGPSTGPNRLANDLHIFIIENDGGVYGNGSVMSELYGPNGTKYASRSDVSCNASVIKAAELCSGSITDNGGKIIYKLP